MPLRSRFSFAQPALLVGRAQLGAEALELKGWGLRGRYRRRFPLAEILHADARAERLVVWLAGGEVLRLRLPDAERWGTALAQSSIS